MILHIWHHAQERIQNFETDDLLRLAWGLPEGSFFHCASAGGPAKLSPGGPSPDILFPPSAIFCHGCHVPGTCSSSIENDA